MMDQGNHALSPTYQLSPSSSTNFPSASCQWLHETSNEHSRMPPSRVASTIKCKGYVSVLMPHAPYHPPRTDQPSLTMQDEQIRPKVQLLTDIPMVEDEQCPLTTICTSDFTPFPTTLASPPSVLWDPAPPPWIFEEYLDEVSPLPNCTSTMQCLCSSTPVHTSSTWESRNSKDNKKVGEVNRQVTEEIRAATEGNDITKVLCT